MHKFRRYFTLALSLILLMGSSSLILAQQNPGLQRVGPLNQENGFPLWYEDTTNLILNLCEDQVFCSFIPPDPIAPVSFPENYPDEAFWMAAGVLMETAGAGRFTATFAVEAAFDGTGEVLDGKQISFARVRIRMANLVPGETYTVTHPYGTLHLTADDFGDVFFTNDVGIIAGNFSGATQGAIGPFLTWDPLMEAPAGFIGDPAFDHRVTGSPTGNNFVRVEGVGIGDAGNPFLCLDPALGPDPIATTDCIENDLFALEGQIATQFGAGVRKTSFTRTTADTEVSVWGFSAADSQLVASIDGGVTDLPMQKALLTDDYFVVVPQSSALPVPETITVTNITDNPPTVSVVLLGDELTITQADYDNNTGVLTVTGGSGDLLNPPIISVHFDSGDATDGTLDLNGSMIVAGVGVPPATVTLTSSNGGSVSSSINVIAVTPAILAEAGPNQIVARNATTFLDGVNSIGAGLSYSWQQVSSQPAGVTVALAGAGTQVASFAFPNQDALLTFQLIVSDGVNASSSDFIQVTNVAVADAGPDQDVPASSIVALDATASQGFGIGYSWTQIAGLTANLDNPSSATPTFTMPAGATSATFDLTVSGLGGVSTDTVVINVSLISPPSANAGPDVSVLIGDRVQLDGSASLGTIDSFSWVQTAGAPVFLGILQPNGSLLPGGESVVNPVFDFPQTAQVMTFQLTVTNTIGSSSDLVSVTGSDPVTFDTLSLSKNQYRTGKSEWNITGQSSIPGGQNHLVTVHVGPDLTGPVIGTSIVDVSGKFTIRERNSSVIPDGTQTISLESTFGGTLLAVPLDITK